MLKVTITGGTGMIGKELSTVLLAKGYGVNILTRNTGPIKDHGAEQPDPRIHYYQWDIENETIDADAIRHADYIIHLAGANVGEKRWTQKRKQEIVDSRVKSGNLLVKTLRETPNNIKAVISASAIGWYGPDRNNGKPFTETDPAHDDFLATTCMVWENAIRPVTEMNKRLVIFRTGIVLSKNGGALAEFLKPLKAGMATILGSGKQIISWIHIDDLVNLYITAIENENLSGVYNAVSSNPVTNKEFVIALARAKKKFFIPAKVPAFVLKSVLGEMSIEVLKSARVSNEKIKKEGFEFKWEGVGEALKDIVEGG